MKTAMLAFYEKPLWHRIVGYAPNPPLDHVVVMEEYIVKRMKDYYSRHDWKVMGVIGFEDERSLKDIAQDLSTRLGTGAITGTDAEMAAEISQSQRPIIAQAFAEYFTKRA